MLGAEKSEKTLTLTGFYPDDAAHEKIRAVAQEKFAGLAVTDQLQQGAGAPKGFLAASLAGLEQLARLRAGQFALLDGAVSLDGEAVTAEVADEVKTAFVAAVPAGFAVKTQLTGAAREAPPSRRRPRRPKRRREAPPAPKAVAIDPHVDAARTCRDQLRVLLLATPIRFEYARAEISPDFSPRSSLSRPSPGDARRSRSRSRVIGVMRIWRSAARKTSSTGLSAPVSIAPD